MESGGCILGCGGFLACACEILRSDGGDLWFHAAAAIDGRSDDLAHADFFLADAFGDGDPIIISERVAECMDSS